MKIKTILVITLMALIGWFATSKFLSNKISEISEAEVINNEIEKIVNEKTPEIAQITSDQKNETIITDTENAAKKETVEEKFKKQGFVQDPNNANQLMKKEVDKNGKERTLYVDKYDEGFDPTRKTIKNAIETLETKNGLNPADEMAALRPLDANLQENLMLMGNFRDDENDLEIFFSPISDENGTPLGKDRVCFISPKLKINIQKKEDKAIVRADETGYAVVKLNDILYARFAWSFEKKRTLHGDILNFKDGAFVKTNSFLAKEINISKGEKLKYCE
jgi:hypothetical protein